jgi:hypothetical protein
MLSSLGAKAGSEPDAVDKCVTAFSPIRSFLKGHQETSSFDSATELGHHFVTTAVIYIIRLTRRFIREPNIQNYRSIRTWVDSNHLKDNLRYYERQHGESYLIYAALRTSSTPLVLLTAMCRVCILRIRKYLKTAAQRPNLV